MPSPNPMLRLTELLQKFGPEVIQTDPERLAVVSVDHRQLYHGRALALAVPRNVSEVSALLAFCNARRIAVVPQGGNTGYCAAATPDDSGQELVLSLRRLNKIRRLDPDNDSMIVEAGCILAEVQRAAESINRFFPLSLGSEGSCQIGGNLSTNAGGLNVVRYGMARDLVLGLEVVLADGRVLETLGGLRKDNTGYDLKHLFIGAEGTLGVITAASLKLFPAPLHTATTLVAVSSVEAAVSWLARLKQDSGGEVSSFELIPRTALELVHAHLPDASVPLELNVAWYVLAEITSSRASSDVDTVLQESLSHALEAGWVTDAVLAQSERERKNLWYLRENIPEAQRRAGASLKHDISVSIHRLAEFIERASDWVEREVPEALLVCYGHAGDGNLHFNINEKSGASPDALLARGEVIKRAIHDLTHELGGSFSAEHGIGRLKVTELERYGSEVELSLMRAIKQSLDPHHIMNPGKVLRG